MNAIKFQKAAAMILAVSFLIVASGSGDADAQNVKVEKKEAEQKMAGGYSASDLKDRSANAQSMIDMLNVVERNNMDAAKPADRDKKKWKLPKEPFEIEAAVIFNFDPGHPSTTFWTVTYDNKTRRKEPTLVITTRGEDGRVYNTYKYYAKEKKFVCQDSSGKTTTYYKNGRVIVRSADGKILSREVIDPNDSRGRNAMLANIASSLYSLYRAYVYKTPFEEVRIDRGKADNLYAASEILFRAAGVKPIPRPT